MSSLTHSLLLSVEGQARADWGTHLAQIRTWAVVAPTSLASPAQLCPWPHRLTSSFPLHLCSMARGTDRSGGAVTSRGCSPAHGRCAAFPPPCCWAILPLCSRCFWPEPSHPGRPTEASVQCAECTQGPLVGRGCVQTGRAFGGQELGEAVAGPPPLAFPAVVSCRAWLSATWLQETDQEPRVARY